MTVSRIATLVAGTIAVLQACSEAPLRRLLPESPVSMSPLRKGVVSQQELSQCPVFQGIYSAGNWTGLARVFSLPVETTSQEPNAAGTYASIHFLRATDLLLPAAEGQPRPWPYSPTRGETFQIEVAPTKPKMARIVVRSSTGAVGSGEMYVFSDHENSCQDGVLRAHASDGRVTTVWWVDRETGDILEAANPARTIQGRPGGTTRDSSKPSAEDNERSWPTVARYKRLSK